MEDKYRPSGKDYLTVNDNKILKIDREYIKYLKLLAEKNSMRKCTMCLHNDIREHVHEMINVYPQETYVSPHSHPLKTETKIIIEGKMLIMLFDIRGEILEEFIMEREGFFSFRVDKGIIHTIIPLTDIVYYEIISGPFVGKNDNVFYEWAPKPDNDTEIKKWMFSMKQKSKILKEELGE